MHVMKTFALCFSALPALFREELRDEEATEGDTVTLHCELTKAAPVEWKKGHAVLKPSEKYKMRQKDATAELVIHNLDESDAGDYTCVCGDKQSTASLAVHGNHVFHLDVLIIKPLFLILWFFSSCLLLSLHTFLWV